MQVLGERAAGCVPSIVPSGVETYGRMGLPAMGLLQRLAELVAEQIEQLP